MKIHILSDLHTEFDPFDMPHSDSDVVVLAGDTHVGLRGVEWAISSIPEKPVLYVLGNHEYYRQAYPKLIRKVRERIEGTNLILLENDSIEMGDVTFHGATLWTDFELFGDPRVAGYECQQKMTDFKKIRREPGYSKIRALDISSIHKKSLKWLEKSLKFSLTEKNVILSHHAPSLRSMPEKLKDDLISAAYTSNLEGFIGVHKPNLWVHGHVHVSSDYFLNGCRVVCNPRGYPDERNPEFSSQLVIDL